MKTWLLVGMLALPAFAEDAGSVIAALNDEAAECRYLHRLCEESQDMLRGAKRNLDAGNHRGAEPYLRASDVKLGQLTSALRVIEVKRGKVPGCFTVCEAVE